MDYKYKLHIIPTTHWDREWYLSFESYRYRLIKLMDRLLELLETDSRFSSFTLDGQFLAIKDYLDVRPERTEQVKKFVKSGRLVIGPWYTQPMETISSGESLVRNLLFGISESEKMGAVLNVGFMVDQFSHIPQLPQICKGFGIEDLIIWRGVPRESKGVFRWTGSDGTEAYVFYSNFAYGDAVALPKDMEDHVEIIDSTQFARKGLKNRIKDSIDRRASLATTPNLMLLNGIDHSFVQEDLSEIVTIINDKMPELKAVIASPEEYIKAVKKHHQGSKILYPTYSGEMNDSYDSLVLTDAHSTRVQVKQWNRRIEGLLEKWAEPYTSIAWLLGREYPSALLYRAWDLLLQNHAHDSINCSSLDTVYRQVIGRFESANDIALEIIDENLSFLCNSLSAVEPDDVNKVGMVLFNPLSWNRNEVVTISVKIPGALGFAGIELFSGGKEIPLTVLEKRSEKVFRFNPFRGQPSVVPVDIFTISFLTEEVPGLGYRVYEVRKANKDRSASGTMKKGHNTADNQYLSIDFNPNGTFNVYDKKAERMYAGLHFFEDRGEAGDGFASACPVHDRIVYNTGSSANITLVEDTPFNTIFKIETEIRLPQYTTHDDMNRSEDTVACPIVSYVTLSRDSRRIDIKTTIDNKARDHRLRVVFPTGLKTGNSFAELPYDVVPRPVHVCKEYGSEGEKPRNTFPTQTFVDVSDGKHGVMLANKGLYEYEVTDDEERSLALTLLRGVKYIFKGGFDPLEEAQCLGKHTFEYSLIFHDGTWEKGYKDAHAFSHPMKAVIKGTMEESMLPFAKGSKLQEPFKESGAFVSVTGENLYISAIKRHETRESLVVRLVNLSDAARSGQLKINIPGIVFTSAYCTNLKEERQACMDLTEGCSIEVRAMPKQILTFEFCK